MPAQEARVLTPHVSFRGDLGEGVQKLLFRAESGELPPVRGALLARLRPGDLFAEASVVETRRCASPHPRRRESDQLQAEEEERQRGRQRRRQWGATAMLARHAHAAPDRVPSVEKRLFVFEALPRDKSR